MTNHNIFSLFQSRFPEDRTESFIQTENGSGYSYADVERESARFANYLTQLGIKKGDRVAAQVDKSPQALFLYLGCVRAGFIYLPLNTAYKESEIAYFLENAQPAAVIGRPTVFASISALAESQGIKHVLTLDEAGGGTLIEQTQAVEPEFETVACAKDDIATILYTSGTTGRSKGAMITHGNLGANGLALVKTWGFSQNDVLLHALPIFHIHGLFVACHCVLLSGAKMFFLPKFDAAAIKRLLPKSTVLMGVPTFYTRLLDDPGFSAETCRNTRLFISGSAPLLEQTFQEFQQRTGHTILERYGMTETGMNTSNPLDGPRKAGSVGLPLPGVSVRVVDANDQPLPSGEVGEFQVKGDNVFLGYWRMPEKNKEEFTQGGYFRTGDLVKIDANGYVFIVGRSKDMIITGGYNVYPKEVEDCIDNLEGVVESAVVGLPHKDFGETVTAVVVCESGRSDITEQSIIKALRQELANYKIPKRVMFAEALQRNTMGKVQKNKLRNVYAELAKAE